jgi:hypothetical protein
MSDDRSESFALATDSLADLAAPEVQRLAARMVQDAFTRIFRLTVECDEATACAAVDEIARLSRNWIRAAADDDARALRLAMLVSGMDQWRLAWCQAFGLASIPAVSAVLDELRGGWDVVTEARFQQHLAAMQRIECDAVDFKMELGRNIHLALWHAMIACDERNDALAILAALGGMLVALVGRMPVIGWRLVADALAHIQLRCLMDAAASDGLARETTEELFNVLRQAIPREICEPMLAHANQAVVAWQRSRRTH